MAKEEKKAPAKKLGTAPGMYKIEGGKLAVKNKTCPKCGPGYFLAEHSNRVCCGKCGYTEFRR